MKILRYFLRIFPTYLLAGLLLVSCSSEPKRPRKKRSTEPHQIQKLKDYSLNLSLLTSRREFYAGETNVTLTFALKNTGLAPVVLKDWHMVEEANLLLFYSLVDEKGPWTRSMTFDPRNKRNDQRTTLILNPGNNKALISAPAVFFRDLQQKNRKTKCFIRAELNLDSVTVKSNVTTLTIK